MNKSFEDNVFVKNSELHGLGLFTSINIPKDTKIMVIAGEVISSDECVRREEEDNNVYIFWNDMNYIDTSKTDKIKFINHQCDYNCIVADRDESSLWLVTARDINANEELTIDYGYDEIYENCNCNSCQNKINDL
ncbi:MAG: hypothetical protein STSR0008_06820 [Ignavibacterium sp.]